MKNAKIQFRTYRFKNHTANLCFYMSTNIIIGLRHLDNQDMIIFIEPLLIKTTYLTPFGEISIMHFQNSQCVVFYQAFIKDNILAESFRIIQQCRFCFISLLKFAP